MTVREVTSPPTVAPPLPDAVTVIVPVEGVTPPPAVAVIVAEPADTAVAKPSEFTVATAGALELQVTVDVTSSVVGGCDPWSTIPVAVN
jgi:hypothetical protein